MGTSGGDDGVRGLVAAYDADSGKEVWRFWTIPGPGEFGSSSWPGESYKLGGGTTWMPGTFDPELNTIFWGTSNPAPDFDGGPRPGDDLYTDCLLALDPDTGKLKWYFQFTPHDDFDYDAVQVPVLADIRWPGAAAPAGSRKVMLWANRNGYFYALDRTTGKFLLGKPFVKVTWSTGLDETGRPMRINSVEPTEAGTDIYPSQTGGTNWYSPSFSPRTGLFYVSAWEHVHGKFQKVDAPYEEGKRFSGGGVQPTRGGTRGPQVTKVDPEDGFGVVRALDPKTGELLGASDGTFGSARRMSSSCFKRRFSVWRAATKAVFPRMVSPSASRRFEKS